MLSDVATQLRFRNPAAATVTKARDVSSEDMITSITMVMIKMFVIISSC